MSDFASADDLDLLSASFEAVLADEPGPGEADQTLYDLGWPDLLDAIPGPASAIAFSALGTTGAAATLLDDVVAHALGMPISPDVCVLFPGTLHSNPAAPQPGDPKSLLQEDPMVINGLVSSRIDRATTLVMAMDESFGAESATLDTGLIQETAATGVDPAHPYRHLSTRVPSDALVPLEIEGSWDAAMAAARVALAHQLIGGADWMLAEARQHAIDRVQFGRPVASFQAIRHKLADSLVLIEGAGSVAGACLFDSNPLLAALAKCLAGRAALTTANHAQQVLAGIGFTAEHQFHHWLKRTLVLDTLFGSTRHLSAEIGRDLLIHGTVPRLIQL